MRWIVSAVVIAALAVMSISSARAQSYPDQGAAYAACSSDLGGVGDRVIYEACTQSGNAYYCNAWTTPPPNGSTRSCGSFSGTQHGSYYSWPAGKTCSSRPSQSTLFLPPGGSTRCNNGCEQKYTWMGADSQGRETTMADYTGSVCNSDKSKESCNAKNPGGTTPPSWVYNGYLGVCQPINTECPADTKSTPDGKCVANDECPLSHVLNAAGVCVKKDEDCAAGTIRGLDGMCKQDEINDKSKCPSGQAKGKDGTCKVDSNNDGIPDADQDPNDPNNNKDGKQFSGGDNCNAPPTCSGDPIMCGQARIQWRIDCNTRKQANIEGGACDRMPVCAGDGCKPIEHAQLIQQWKTACAVQELARKGITTNPGQGGSGTDPVPNPDTSGVADGQLDGALGENGEGEPGDAFSDGSGHAGQPGGIPGANGLNTNGYGWSRSCPSPPSIDLMGQSITFDIGPFCNWMALGGWLVLIFASFLSVRILTSSGSGSV